MQPKAGERVLVFGGTFDPPHVGHVRLPLAACERVGADWVAYIPAAVSPFKTDQPPAPAHHRLAMLRLALADQPRALILTDELDRSPDQASFTIDTLRALAGRWPGVELRLLIGADQARQFHRWREPEAIEALAPPLVMLRPPDTAVNLLASLSPDMDRNLWAGRIVELPMVDVAAREVRQRLARGQPVDDMVPPVVAQYIHKHSLYAQPSDDKDPD